MEAKASSCQLKIWFQETANRGGKVEKIGWKKKKTLHLKCSTLEQINLRNRGCKNQRQEENRPRKRKGLIGRFVLNTASRGPRKLRQGKIHNNYGLGKKKRNMADNTADVGRPGRGKGGCGRVRNGKSNNDYGGLNRGWRTRKGG